MKLFEKGKEELKEKIQEAVLDVQELSSDALDPVSGAGNPFDDVPRVPNSPIDEELRDKA